MFRVIKTTANTNRFQTVSFTASTEAAARNWANNEWRNGAKNIRIFADSEMIAQVGDDAALASTIANAHKGVDDDTRTGMGKWPEWLLATFDNDGVINAVEELPSQKVAEETISQLDEAGIPAILFHHLMVERITKTVNLNTSSVQNPMDQIDHFNIGCQGVYFTGTVSVPRGPLAKKVSELTGRPVNEVIVKITSRINGLESENEEIRTKAEEKKAAWDRTIEKGFSHKGERFVVLGHGTNAAKECEVVAVPASVADQIFAWATNQADGNWNVTVAKMIAYAGLSMVSIKPYVSKGIKVEPEDFQYWKTLEHEINSDAVRVMHNGDVIDVNTISQKGTDGSAVISFSSKKIAEICENDAAKIAEFKQKLNELQGHSFRLSLNKGYATVMKIDGMQTFLRSIGINEIDGRSIDDVVVFADNSVFKGKFGEKGSHASQADFCEKWHRDHTDRDIGVLIESAKVDGKHGRLPNQTWTCLPGLREKQLQKLMEQEESWLNSLTPGEIIGGMLGKLVNANPGLMNVKSIRERFVESKQVLVDEAKQGRFHNLTRMFAGNGDIFAWAHFNATGEYVPYIPANVVIVRGLKLAYEGQPVVILRSPQEDPGSICIANCYSSFKAAGCREGKLLDSITRPDGTIFFSNEDDMVTRMRGDFDGDHFFIIDNSLFVNIIRDAMNRAVDFGDGAKRAPLVDWEESASVKKAVAKADRQQYLRNLVVSPNPGTWDNAIRKLMSTRPFNKPLSRYDFCAIAQATKKFNVDGVDASKHGASGDNFELHPALNGISEVPMGRGFAMQRAERRGTELNEKQTMPSFGNNAMDTIRLYFDRMEVQLPAIPGEIENVRLENAVQAPHIYNLIGKPAYGFFPYDDDGNLAKKPVVLLHFSSFEEAISSIEMGHYVQVRGRNTIASDYAAVHIDGDTAIFGIDGDTIGEEVHGKWICLEWKSPVFSALESRVQETLMSMNKDEKLKSWVSDYRKNAAIYNRLALEAYALFYGYDIKAAYNKIVSFMFREDMSPNAWRPNKFTLRFFEMIFAQEIKEVIEQKIGNLLDGDLDDELFIPSLD